MKRAMDIAKHRFSPESISFLNRATGERGNVEEITDGLKTENLRDPKIQEELIGEYLKDYQVSSQTLEKVYELNRAYNKIIEETEEVSRNVNWKLGSFEFDNLFNFGSGNSINFENMGGIIGIFGKNFSGKSSVIDAALYTLFNTTSKNERKNLNVINQNKDACVGKLTIESNNKVYTVERKSEKYVKRLKGEETLEAKTDLNFEVFDLVTEETTSLNGTTRNQTDAIIRKHFGSIDDFMVSSLASQHGALAFIDEGSTRRKEIIAKFLDLEIFEKKFRMSKEASAEAKVLIRKHEDRDYAAEISAAAEELNKNQNKSEKNKSFCESLRIKLNTLTDVVRLLEEQIRLTPSEVVDITNLRKEHKKKVNSIVALGETIKEQSQFITLKSEEISATEELLKTIDHQKNLEGKQAIEKLDETINSLNQELENIVKKQKLLEGIPCGDAFPTCKFIRDAHVSVATRDIAAAERDSSIEARTALNPEEIELEIEERNTLQIRSLNFEKEISELKLKRERNKTTKSKIELSLKDITTQIKEYEENREAIENLEKLIKEKNKHQKEMKNKLEEVTTCEQETLEIVKSIGSYEQKIENLQEQQTECIELQNSYAAYDLFMQCMHPNGIAYDVIKKKIPVINQEVAKVLANIVDFEIFFESSGNKFDIFIKHPLYDERPIEMASGAEKTMAAMAIRLALLSVSSLPKSDLFVLDEPGTALDEENMEGFIRILELIKVYFKNVLLISHLDSLKDCVDMQIVIEKKDGYARVNQ